jgi:hypothetical protein
VVSELDIWRTANLLIDHHGSGAASEAARYAGRVLDRGDFAGWSVWARIRVAIEALQAPPQGEPN